jgi:hypothetical protein
MFRINQFPIPGVQLQLGAPGMNTPTNVPIDEHKRARLFPPINSTVVTAATGAAGATGKANDWGDWASNQQPSQDGSVMGMGVNSNTAHQPLHCLGTDYGEDIG